MTRRLHSPKAAPRYCALGVKEVSARRISLVDTDDAGGGAAYGSMKDNHQLIEPPNPNVSFLLPFRNFAPMTDAINDAINSIAKGDTRLAESFFCRPGGRRYLENLSLILLNTLLPHSTEKEEMYAGFVQVLNQLENRIVRQQEGATILEAALQPPAGE